jgi:hypothetical protein
MVIDDTNGRTTDHRSIHSPEDHMSHGESLAHEEPGRAPCS